jgi:predicted ribosomally synthesized peptide with SipW-like signal peptide
MSDIQIAGGPAKTPGGAGASKTGAMKKWLVGLLLLGVLSTLISTGTFASFNATLTQNSGITTGVLVLGNKTDAAAECFSSPGAITTNSAACSTAPSIFSATGIGTSAPQYHDLTLRNAGDLTNALLSLSATACNDVAAPVNGFGGATQACPSIQFMVAEVANFTPGAGPTAVTNCYFGNAAGTFTTPGAPANVFNGCGFGAGAATTLHGAGGFDTQFLTGTSSLNLGALTLAPGRNFILGAMLPATATNAMQGRGMTMTFTWFAQ